MAKKKVKNKKPSKKYSKYRVEGNKLIRGKTCPKCGASYFLAEHKNRVYCGNCKYTEFSHKK
ncbi:30S ribosomal protein S27ae [Candidatus Woesearchaeota archaeon]|nr:30S ribosomal protein S27ae [Candidatus Woesearchaeota archaeon]